MTVLTRTVRVAGGTTMVDCLGSRSDPAVVFVHAALLDRCMWHPTMLEFAGSAGPRTELLAYDLRGHGGAAQTGRLATVAQLADDLLTLLDTLAIDVAHLVGTSMGGAVAQHAAAYAPARVQSLTLVATAARFPEQPLLSRAASLNPSSRQSVVSETLRRWLGPEPPAHGEAVRYARSLLNAVDQTHWKATWSALAGYRVPEAASEHDIPVLALSGEHDSSTPPEAASEMCAHYRRSEHRTIAGAAHLIPLLFPDEVAGAVCQQLQAPPVGGRKTP